LCQERSGVGVCVSEGDALQRRQRQQRREVCYPDAPIEAERGQLGHPGEHTEISEVSVAEQAEISEPREPGERGVVCDLPAAAQARVAAYQDMLKRFQKLIDAGTLKVKIVNGRMVVELATDVLFASGKAELSPSGKGAIREVAVVLASIAERKYQVEGHTDNVPISTAQYPSNRVLASARAITVVQSMIEGGLASDKVSAASFGDTLPVSANDTAEGRAANRRIEIVILPDLSGLPGFQELQSLSR
jgi:flagellar motor protein MotB